MRATSEDSLDVSQEPAALADNGSATSADGIKVLERQMDEMLKAIGEHSTILKSLQALVKGHNQSSVSTPEKLRGGSGSPTHLTSRVALVSTNTDTAATERKTRGALLGEIRNGRLEAAVQKMEKLTDDCCGDAT
eukprot:SAG11_NODE_367_length_10114_cov_16.930904_2_plen_135_part_00